MNDPHIGRIVVDENELQQRVSDLGKAIAAGGGRMAEPFSNDGLGNLTPAGSKSAHRR